IHGSAETRSRQQFPPVLLCTTDQHTRAARFAAPQHQRRDAPPQPRARTWTIECGRRPGESGLTTWRTTVFRSSPAMILLPSQHTDSIAIYWPRLGSGRPPGGRPRVMPPPCGVASEKVVADVRARLILSTLSPKISEKGLTIPPAPA